MKAAATDTQSTEQNRCTSIIVLGILCSVMFVPVCHLNIPVLLLPNFILSVLVHASMHTKREPVTLRCSTTVTANSEHVPSLIPCSYKDIIVQRVQ